MDTSGEIQDDSQGYTIGIETMARPRKPPHAKQDKPKEKVTLGDTAGMKHALDSAAAEVSSFTVSLGYTSTTLYVESCLVWRRQVCINDESICCMGIRMHRWLDLACIVLFTLIKGMMVGCDGYLGVRYFV